MSFVEFIMDMFFAWCSNKEPQNKKLKTVHKLGNKFMLYVGLPITVILLLCILFWFI